MEGAVHRFVRLLRLVGVRISVSETLDAVRVAAVPGVLADRDVLRDALAVTLVKDRRDQPAFDRVFDAFFRLRPVLPPAPEGHGHTHDDLDDGGETEAMTLSEEPSKTPQQGHSHGKPADIRDYFDEQDLAEQYNLHQEANKIDLAALTDEIVLSTDRTSVLGEAARVELTVSRLHGAGAPGDLVRSDRPALDVMLSVAQELALLDWLAGEVGSDGDLDPEDLARLRRRIGGLLVGLPERLKDHLEKLLALDREVESQGLTPAPVHDPLDEEQRADLEESLRRLVRTMHGAPRARRRVSAAGRVDGSRTMRQSMRYDGIPFRPVTVSRPHDRPRLVVLVDVSLSVRATSRFTLHVVHGLSSLVSQVRSWAFVADAVETTDLFAERHPEDALGLVVAGLPAGGVLDVDADSDYGSVFGAFVEENGTALTRRTTLVVLGDGRGNGHDPNVAAFEEMTRRVRETVWLTPEPSYSWRLGRCDLPLYAEHCSRVQVVRDLSGLDRLAPGA
ncbi:VWA domain-containing protein [Kineosporia sp. A_224]|uniref:VWA domain-containing protein n=1 Tax=Kineosporia sp. A_224 TaxID=1962180 RepID=UPI000B4B49B6|nr:VWA domain-containing protein [Kineosporia sp. A_224]